VVDGASVILTGSTAGSMGTPAFSARLRVKAAVRTLPAAGSSI
jgi:hypothetical protein